MSEPAYHVLPLSVIDGPDAMSRDTIDVDKLAELAASIETIGQLQPIGVVPNGARYTIVYGHRRFLAMESVGMAAVRALVFESTSEAMLDAQFAENAFRHDLNPVEEAYWFARLWEALKCGTDTLAARLHLSLNYVEGRLALLRGDEKVLAALRDETIGIGVAQVLNGIDDAGARLYFLDCASRLHAPVRTVQQWVAEWRARGPATAPSIDMPQGDAPPAVALEEPPKPTCVFCGGDEEPWTLEFEWIHRHCKRARNNMLDAQFREGPVREG